MFFITGELLEVCFEECFGYHEEIRSSFLMICSSVMTIASKEFQTCLFVHFFKLLAEPLQVIQIQYQKETNF